MNTIILILSSIVAFAFGAETAQSKIYRDHRSGFEWRPMAEPMVTWTQAKTKCASLAKGWRLPSRNDFSKSLRFLEEIPEIKARYDLAFWSSTKYEQDTAPNGRVYAYYQGKIALRDVEVEEESIYPIVCVRAHP